MLEICKKNQVNLIIPGSDEEALILSEKRSLFENENIQLCAADYMTLEILNDKSRTYEELHKIPEIKAPQWMQVFSKEEIIAEASMLHEKIGDIVIKPALSRGGRDIVVISDEFSDPKVVEGGREIHLNFEHFKNNYID